MFVLPIRYPMYHYRYVAQLSLYKHCIFVMLSTSNKNHQTSAICICNWLLLCVFYAPNFEKVGEHVRIGLSAFMYECMYVASRYIVWISNGKKQTHTFSELSPHVKLRLFEKQVMKFCKCCISKSIKARNSKLVSADRG